MDAKELRLECLKLAVEFYNRADVKPSDARFAAEIWYDFIVGPRVELMRTKDGRFAKVAEAVESEPLPIEPDPPMPKAERTSFMQRVFGE